MRKLSRIPSQKCKILFFDDIGSGFAHRCIPDEAKTVFLNFRNTVPIGVNGRFFRGTFFALYSRPLFARKSISYILLSGLIDHLGPKVLLSFADNNQVLAQYTERRPKFPVVLVQSAIRTTVGSISNRYSLPIYLSFGEVERSIFKDLQITNRLKGGNGRSHLFSQAMSKRLRENDRIPRIWSETYLRTHPGFFGDPRETLIQTIQTKSSFNYLDFPSTHIPQKEFWKNYGRYRFVISLPGHGLDCY